MPRKKSSKKNSAVKLINWHVKEVEYLEQYRLLLTFADGSKKIVDLAPHLHGPIFLPLKKMAYFKSVHVHPELETICWDNGADFAPEFLYEIGVASNVKRSA